MTTQPTRTDYEHAARAAGIEIWRTGIKDRLPFTGTGEWNPYNDSADAFRLMAECGLFVKCKSNSVQICTPHGEWMTFFHNDENPELATRHAIFWAAVAIGKQMINHNEGE